MNKKSAWLVAWEASTEKRLAQVKGPRILAFFDSRKSDSTIREIVFGLYLASPMLTHQEKVYYGLANQGKKTIKVDDFGCVKCGLNPWIVARQVEDSRSRFSTEEISLCRWKQPQFTYPNRKGAVPIPSLECKEEKITINAASMR